jgi:hypothetical protein
MSLSIIFKMLLSLHVVRKLPEAKVKTGFSSAKIPSAIAISFNLVRAATGQHG